MNSPPSAVSVPSARAGCGDALHGRVPVPADDVLLAPRERAAHGPAGPLRELGREQDVVAGAVLRAEAAAHELADDANPVLRQPERLGELAPNAPDVLRRDVDVEPVAAPLADALVRLERVVVERLGAVVGLDDGVRLGEAALEVAALVAAASRPAASRARTASSASSSGSSSSHSTSISASAASACASVSAATAATALPS